MTTKNELGHQQARVFQSHLANQGGLQPGLKAVSLPPLPSSRSVFAHTNTLIEIRLQLRITLHTRLDPPYQLFQFAFTAERLDLSQDLS
ncbi:unnamed protein product [Strongylus vulgaris]|uniref:Uncharacterized protein n=1 Tax=Strongylus vulgaris TaxID=40348 RepID=A0A3P7HZ45_STRVU|nr:unnamed protein product [Strongylus vulgaris]